jgi:hypothetical protein
MYQVRLSALTKEERIKAKVRPTTHYVELEYCETVNKFTLYVIRNTPIMHKLSRNRSGNRYAPLKHLPVKTLSIAHSAHGVNHYLPNTRKISA